MRRIGATLALLALACGGEQPAGEQQQEPAAAPETPAMTAAAPAEGTGTVHEIQMVMNAAGQYRFVPAQLTIKAGDTVRWLNVSGFPHNVAFYADRIPSGAVEPLASLMPAQGKLGPLSGRLLTQPNETFAITFTGVPTGEYGYFCVPHEALGMVASLTIEP